MGYWWLWLHLQGHRGHWWNLMFRHMRWHFYLDIQWSFQTCNRCIWSSLTHDNQGMPFLPIRNMLYGKFTVHVRIYVLIMLYAMTEYLISNDKFDYPSQCSLNTWTLRRFAFNLQAQILLFFVMPMGEDNWNILWSIQSKVQGVFMNLFTLKISITSALFLGTQSN